MENSTLIAGALAVVLVFFVSLGIALGTRACDDSPEPCSSSMVARMIEDTMSGTWPYADRPDLPPARVLSVAPVDVPGKENVCVVEYQIGDDPPERRMYALESSGCQWSTKQLTLPYESQRWCTDPTCRGYLET